MLKARLGYDFDERIARAVPFLFHPRVHPNALSVVGVLVSLGGAWAFAEGALRLGAVIVLLGGVFDLVDGVVARHQGRVTTFGGFLDSSLDRVVDMALLLGLVMHYAGRGAVALGWLAALALVATVLVSYTKARAESVVPDFKGGLLERAERIVILVLGGLTGWMPLALGVVAVGSVITAGQRIALAHQAVRRRPPMSPDEPERGPGFTIVDRRGSRDEPEAAAPPERGMLPPADFGAIALSFASSALYHLGLVADSETGEPGLKNLPLARHSIDLLELLQQKTRGNLSADEADLLTNLLTELRVRYVESSKGG